MYGFQSNFLNYLRGNSFRSSTGVAIKAVVLSVYAAVLTACSIHPVQQEVTGVPTKGIVNRIRCEARLAVLDKAIAVLRIAADNRRATAPVIAEKFDVIIGELASQRGHTLRKFDPKRLPTDLARKFYGRYINTVIAYDFLMQGVENNRAGFAADPVRLITNGVAGVTLGGSGEFNRDNQRHFAIADTFEELLFSPMECESLDYLPENFVYPISGRVGLREVVDTFIDLNEFKSLNAFGDDKTVFADTLKFMTTWGGGATPHIQIDPVGTRWGLDSPTNIGLSASRADTHTLTVGLVMGPQLIVPLSGFLSPPVFGPRVSRSNSIQQSNKAAAFEAIQQLRYRSFLDRAGTQFFR